MNSRRSQLRFPKRTAQSGAALLVSLILLVVITLVGLAAIGTTILQNRMAANQYDRQIAFQATEAAMGVADNAIKSNPALTATPAPAGIEDCSASPYTSDATPPNPPHPCLANPFADPTLATNGGTITGVTPAQFNPGSLAASAPQYVIQYMGCFPGPKRSPGNLNSTAPPITFSYNYYRITARSGDPTTVGVGGRAFVTMQSIFRYLSCPNPS